MSCLCLISVLLQSVAESLRVARCLRVAKFTLSTAF